MALENLLAELLEQKRICQEGIDHIDILKAHKKVVVIALADGLQTFITESKEAGLGIPKRWTNTLKAARKTLGQ